MPPAPRCHAASAASSCTIMLPPPAASRQREHGRSTRFAELLADGFHADLLGDLKSEVRSSGRAGVLDTGATATDDGLLTTDQLRIALLQSSTSSHTLPNRSTERWPRTKNSACPDGLRCFSKHYELSSKTVTGSSASVLAERLVAELRVVLQILQAHAELEL